MAYLDYLDPLIHHIFQKFSFFLMRNMQCVPLYFLGSNMYFQPFGSFDYRVFSDENILCISSRYLRRT